jgi:hypothetical protein
MDRQLPFTAIKKEKIFPEISWQLKSFADTSNFTARKLTAHKS